MQADACKHKNMLLRADGMLLHQFPDIWPDIEVLEEKQCCRDGSGNGGGGLKLVVYASSGCFFLWIRNT